MANVLQLRDSARNHALLKERIADAFGLASDDPVLVDTVDGESDLKELAAYALREALVIKSRAKALDDLIDGMKGRKERLKLAEEKIREAVALALYDAGERKLALPDMTVSITLRPKLTVDEDQLPDEFKREVITIKPDRDAINAAIDAGQIIPGVRFGNAAPSIRVLTK